MSWRTTATGALLGAAFAATHAEHARADELAPMHARATLDYATAPDLSTCPDKESFVSAVATRLGYDPFANAADAKSTMTVRFRRERAAVVADLRLAGSPSETVSEKSVVSESGACDELGSASAFAAAILLDPRAMFPRPNAKPNPPAVTARSPFDTTGALNSRSPGTWPWYEPPPLPSHPPPPKPEGESIRVHAGVVAVGCVGCAPSPNVGASVFGGLSKGKLGIEIGARADLPTAATSATGRDVSSSLVVGEIFPHARLGPMRPGVLGLAGALFGDSAGQQQVSTWTGAGARVGFEWPVGAAAFLRATLDGVLVISRVSLRIDGQELWSTPAFVVASSLGAGMKF